MKHFTFEMLIENDNLNMIQCRIDDLMSAAPYYAKEFSFRMTESDGEKVYSFEGGR